MINFIDISYTETYYLFNAGELIRLKICICGDFHVLGILKQVKDCIRDCGCQQKSERGKGSAEDGSVPRGPGRRKEEEEEEEEDLEELHAAINMKSKAANVDKHELVFVSMMFVLS